jgi:ankyrin repeat protein
VKTVHRTDDQALMMAAGQRSYRNPTLEPNSEIVRLLLVHGADPNAKGDWGRTALMLANTAAKVKLLVASGANVEARDEEGQTALMKAASNGNAAVVTALLESRANVNAFDNKSMNALLFSLNDENYAHGEERKTLPARRIEVARRLLLAKSINVNAQNVDGETALMRAVRLENVELVKSLLDHGADPKRSDVLGNTAAILAYEKENAEMAELLPVKLKRQPLNVLNAFLRAAVGKKDEEKVTELLGAGADPNHEYAIDYAHKDIKRTVLILAARVGHAGIVQLLLNKGANVKAKGLIYGSEHGLEYGTALEAAESSKHADVAALLRKAGQD